MKTSKITPASLRISLQSCGWALDRFDNMQKTSSEKKYRIKLQSTSVRIEVQCNYDATQYSPAYKEWIRVDGAYYKDISVDSLGRVVIGKYKFTKIV